MRGAALDHRRRRVEGLWIWSVASSEVGRRYQDLFQHRLRDTFGRAVGAVALLVGDDRSDSGRGFRARHKGLGVTFTLRATLRGLLLISAVQEIERALIPSSDQPVIGEITQRFADEAQ